MPLRIRGQAVVEFGIVVLAILLIVGAATDLGWLMAGRQSMSAATSEAGRQVAYANQPGDVISFVQKFVQGSPVNSSKLAISLTYCQGSTNNPPTLPCMPLGSSYCTTDPVPPSPPADQVQGFQCSTDGSGTLPPQGAPRAATRNDWVLIVLTDANWEAFTPLTRALFQAFPNADCNASDKPCLTTLQNSEIVVYPGPPPS